jgi:hypothetical protein
MPAGSFDIETATHTHFATLKLDPCSPKGRLHPALFSNGTDGEVEERND